MARYTKSKTSQQADAKDRRRKEGEIRNEKWRSLSLQKQLEALSSVPGESKKQRGQILKRLSSGRIEKGKENA